MPSENYLNVYEVWIKYNLAISDGDDNPIENWFMPVYGKTASAFMSSKEKAIEYVGLFLSLPMNKLMLDFYRIPAIYGWMMEQQILEESQ